MNLTLDKVIIAAIFYECKAIVVDSVQTTKMAEMQIWEFYTFMCRITQEHYKYSNYSEEALYLKLDAMLAIWLAPVFLSPTFSFHHEFELDK